MPADQVINPDDRTDGKKKGSDDGDALDKGGGLLETDRQGLAKAAPEPRPRNKGPGELDL